MPYRLVEALRVLKIKEGRGEGARRRHEVKRRKRFQEGGFLSSPRNEGRKEGRKKRERERER